MQFILSLLTVVLVLLIIRILIDLPFALLRWIHLPQWLGIAIAVLCFSWLLGSEA